MELSPHELRIIPLGGLGEVGMNMMVYETAQSLILVDAGALFPEHSLLGIDLIIPDMSYLRQRRDKFMGVFITHCHEDHVGAVPFLLKEFGAPVYATRFTTAFIEHKLKEHALKRADLRTVKPGLKYEAGDFVVTPIEVTHSTVDTVSYALETPAGLLIHTGDFKIDLTPPDKSRFDFRTFADLGAKGVRLLLMDSTNSMESGHTTSEREVARDLESILNTEHGRVFITMFSSSIPRIISLVQLAEKYKRKIAVLGRSTKANIQIAQQIGYLKHSSVFIDPSELDAQPDHRVMVLVAGSQGEARSALTRLSYNEHSDIKIREGDVVLYSSRQIPGNERAIANVINNLMLLGAKIYTPRSDRRIHASGHAYREELRTMLSLTQPRCFIPVHGEPHHLITNQRLAQESGVKPEHTLLLRNGQSAILGPEGLEMGESVPFGRVYVDGTGVGDVEEMVIRDRLKLAQTGLLICVATLAAGTWEFISGPEFIQKGVTGEAVMGELLAEAEALVREVVEEMRKKLYSDTAALEEELRIRLRRLINAKLNRKPVVIPIIIEA